MTVSFDELIQKAKEVAVTAGKIAGDVVGEVVDTSKAKLAEAKLNAQIGEVNERLGMIVYEAFKTGKDSLKLQEMLVKELDSLYKTLEELRKTTPVSGTDIFCTQCGEKNPMSASFCTKCGTKLVPVTENEYVVDTEIIDISEVEETAEEISATVEETVEQIAATVETAVEETAAAVEEAVEKLDQ
ncbi:MAG: zinc ribbon domain-containing protein [Angelakisella sp.]